MAEREIIAKLRELQSLYEDLNSRLVTLESWVGKAFFIPPFPKASRWVLEIYPDEIEEWRRAIGSIPTERLTEKERSFLRSIDYYIASERKITIPQLGWLYAIQRKAGGVIPTVPVPTASSSHSNPNQRRYGVPKTDVERIMAHYGITKEEAERLIEDVMQVYGVSREEAVKTLLPPRGTKVKGSSPHSNPDELYICEQCGTTFSTPQEACPVCYGRVEVLVE